MKILHSMDGWPSLQTMPDSSSSSSPVSSPVPVKRACDACHRRKIKCIGDGLTSCKNCSAARLRCTYNAVPQKKGPKGSRAKVISELRETQQQQPPLVPPGHGDSYIPPPYARTAGLLSLDVIAACTDFFFIHMYSTQPILYRQRVQEAIVSMNISNEAYCLICAFCAYVMVQPNFILPESTTKSPHRSPNSITAFETMLLDEAIRIRGSFVNVESPNVWSILIAYFFFGTCFSLDQQNTAWFHLREATTLVITMGLDHEEAYADGDPIESSRKRRLFWLLFVTERCLDQVFRGFDGRIANS